MQRRHYQYLVCCLIIVCACSVPFVFPRQEKWVCIAEPFHRLIEPYPTFVYPCTGVPWNDAAPDRGKYRLEVRLVTAVYGRGASEVPPRSGYLSDELPFMTLVMGDVRHSTLQFPSLIIENGRAANWNAGNLTLQLEKHHDHFRMKYTAPRGITYTQDFDLPEGEIFVTNLGEHPVASGRTSPQLPDLLSFMQHALSKTEPYQMEWFFLIKYNELDTSEIITSEW